MFVYIRSAAFIIVVTRKLVLQQSKNVTAKCTETLLPPPCIQFSLLRSINMLCFSVLVSVCLCPINVKTVDSIGPKCWEGFWIFKILKISLQQNSIVNKFWKSTKIFKTRERFFFCFTMFTNRKCSQLK